MQDILNKAIQHYGPEQQTDKLIEEMSELTKAIMKLRYCKSPFERPIVEEAVDEEMADVEIMMEQLKIIRQNWMKVQDWKDKKLERLETRIRKENEKRD
jgi:hypothetical protein